MKTICFALMTLFALEPTDSSRSRFPKAKRGYYSQEYNLGSLPTGWHGSNNGWLDDYLQVNLAAPSPSLSVLSSNSVDKPVMEAQEIIPPQSVGQAIIPRMPPPATPVNAVASNVPTETGAVFLGSGSLGVVDLGNGAYALGSGAIGYAGNRAQPRPSGMSPLFPRLPASPDLIPAAIPSPQPPQPIGGYPSFDNNNNPVYNPPPVPQYDQNGYEYLPPNRVGFGTPLARIPRVKVRQQFATPTNVQVPRSPQIQNQANFDFTIPFNSHLGI